jgi:hypothetical protein
MLPPIDLLRALVAYEPDTGILRWLPRNPALFADRRAWAIWRAKFEDQPIRKRRRRGYVVVSFVANGVTYECPGHRAAWALTTGAWPEHQIDHEDRDPGNNRWSNLRPATNAENQRNKGLLPTNRSGFKGVHQHTQNGNWVAQIFVDGRKQHLGSFPSPEQAAAAYEAAALQHHGAFAARNTTEIRL